MVVESKENSWKIFVEKADSQIIMQARKGKANKITFYERSFMMDDGYREVCVHPSSIVYAKKKNTRNDF